VGGDGTIASHRWGFCSIRPLLYLSNVHSTSTVGRSHSNEKLSSQSLTAGEPSARVRARVEAVRIMQWEHFGETALQTNSDMGPAEIRQSCPLAETSTNLTKATVR
jgi:predicted ATPase with chaperone activity